MNKSIVMLAWCALACSSVAKADGFYVGAGLGSLNLDNKTTTTNSATIQGDGFDISSSYSRSQENSALGVNASVLMGYAWDTPDSYYVGLEAFDNVSSAKVKSTFGLDGDSYQGQLKINNTLGLRLLPGYHLAPNVVAYGILGVARSRMDAKVSVDGLSGSSVYNFTGYQAGVGGMVKVSQQVSLRADAVYTDYGSKTVYQDSFSDGTVSEASAIKLHPSTTEFNLAAVYNFG